jgi:hypothetical protein
MYYECNIGLNVCASLTHQPLLRKSLMSCFATPGTPRGLTARLHSRQASLNETADNHHKSAAIQRVKTSSNVLPVDCTRPSDCSTTARQQPRTALLLANSHSYTYNKT